MSVVSTSDLDLENNPVSDSDSGSDADVDLDSEGNALGSAVESDGDSSDKVLEKSNENEKVSVSDEKAVLEEKFTDDSSGEFPDCKLLFTKKGDKKVQVGDFVIWNITVKNSLNVAYNVVVQEKLPKNFELVSVNASKGTYNKEMGYWEIGDLNKSESVTLTIKAKAKKAGNFTNKAELFTDSNNLNKTTTVKADVEVVSKEKSKQSVKNKTKKVKKDKKDKKAVNKDKTNKTNNNQTNRNVDLKDTGNPIIVILISVLVVLGLSILKKQ